MLRALSNAALVALFALFGSLRDARAGATVDLLFVGVNGAPMAPTASLLPVLGDTLEMAVLMRNDQTLNLAQFSVEYDVGVGDQLDVVSAFAWVGVTVGPKATNKLAPLRQPNPDGNGPYPVNNVVGSFNSVIGVPPALPLPIFGGSFAASFPSGYQMGTITWVVKGTAGTTITPGLNLQGIGGQAFGAGTGGTVPAATLVFNSAVLINAAVLTPEPAAAALLGLGLCGLALLRRRSREGR